MTALAREAAPEVDAAREQLAARQSAVVAELLAGRAPAGFDPDAARLTARILLRKRASAASYACPEVELLPRWREMFAEYAWQCVEYGCAHDDVAGFRRWLQGRPVTPVVGAWLRLAAVYAGERRGCLAIRAGCWSLNIGVGDTVWHLKLTRARGPRLGRGAQS
ncbi:hypothetical protein HJ588_02665 [Flexivirga sp. ID2601S]|uniref:SCO6045-like C-terminal domain-containing protein n=1 Tax=Flexivirga aerilata TaxID=1656889 RepID=A0A849AF28_9MICO|nr:hypothetical protein [Flexivirga aerilata]NNG38176.1 hypothetical protein [Flexivirga aerilata]